jgi:GNAT superfamily N-acetyltransferase
MAQNWINNALLDNMSFTLRAMGDPDTSRFLSMGEDSFLLATGTDAASENWAFMPAGQPTEATVRRALEFFGDLPFVWPILPGAEGAASVLEEMGLPLRGCLTAMALNIQNQGGGARSPLGLRVCPLLKFQNGKGTGPPETPDIQGGETHSAPEEPGGLTCDRVTTREGAMLWAEAAWRGFDSPAGAPATFINLAQGLCERDDFALVMASRDQEPVGTYMLAGTGVYYFATLPYARRSGVGKAMMNDILRRASAAGWITLQATPSGVPFYASQSFKTLFKIPLHSPSPDIF